MVTWMLTIAPVGCFVRPHLLYMLSLGVRRIAWVVDNFLPQSFSRHKKCWNLFLSQKILVDLRGVRNSKASIYHWLDPIAQLQTIYCKRRHYSSFKEAKVDWRSSCNCLAQCCHRATGVCQTSQVMLRLQSGWMCATVCGSTIHREALA